MKLQNSGHMINGKWTAFI